MRHTAVLLIHDLSALATLSDNSRRVSVGGDARRISRAAIG